MSDYREETAELQDQSASRVAWFVTGAVIGAAVAILYAPKSGRDTRKYIAEKTQQGREAVGSASDNLVDTSKEMFDRGRKLVEDAAELFERGRKLVRG
jgi:gas vesicle protein